MKNNLFLLFAISCFLGIANSVKAGYEKTYGSGSIYNICPTADGNYIVLTSTTNLIKITPTGDTLWTKSYPYFIGDCVQVTADGGFVMSGKNSVADQMMVVKTDANGDTVWTNTSIPIPDAATGSYINNGHHFYIIQTLTNEYVIAGQYTSWFSPSLSATMIILVKLDTNGIFMWEQKFGNYGNGYTCAAQNGTSSIHETLDHDYLISGWFATSPSLCCVATQSCWKNQSYLLKTDTAGTALWNYAGTPNFQGTTLGRYAIPSSDSGCVFLSQNSSISDVIKIGPTGTVLWDTVIDNNDVPYVVKQTNDNGYIIGGASSSGPPLIEKRDAEGNLIWRKSGECNNGYILDIIQTSDGYMAVGTTGGNTYLVKIDNADTVLSCFYPYVNLTINGSLDLCSGDTVTLDAGPGQCNYYWSNGATTQIIYVTSDDTINVIASNSCGSDTSATIIVSVNYLPVSTVNITGDTTFCQGDSVIFSTPSCPGCSYLWNNNDTTQSITVNSNSTISLTVSNSCGSATSNATTVTVNVNPTPAITAGGATSFCIGDSVTLSSTSAFSYQWSNSATTQDITVFASGNYDVTVTDSNGCEATAISIDITVNPTFTISVPAAICQGDSILLQGNYQTAPGTYYDTLTSEDGCDSVITTTLSVNQPALSSVQVSICSGDSILLEGNYQTTVGIYYDTLTTVDGCDSVITTTLSVNQAAFSSAQAAICSGDSIMLEGNYQTAAGTYYDTLSSANGCDSVITTTLTVNLTPATPVISAGGPTTFCTGDSVTFTSSAADSYQWSNSAITQSIIVTAAGNYSVTISDNNGCSASSSVTTVTVINPLTGFSADSTLFYLPNATVTFTATTVGAIISYLWDFGDGNTSAQSNPSHSYTTPGNYSISLTVTDNTGCAATLTMSGYLWVEQVFNASALTTGTTENLTGTSFADPLNGCASMENGNVLFTGDGGLNWTISNTGFTGILNSVYLLGTAAYITGTNGYVAVSPNGGTSWNTYNIGTTVNFNDVYFVNSNLGYLAGANGTIYIYNGINWVLQNTGATVDFYSVFGIGNVAYAVGANGVIYFYNGSIWTPLTSGVTIVLNGIYFVDANLGYAVGASGTILMTSNGGTSWQNIFNGLYDNFNSIVAGGTDTLWAVGTGGIVYQTVNAGLNWTRFSIGTQIDLSAIRYAGQTGYIVGKSGKAFQFGSIPVVVGINEIPMNGKNIKIYPNPFNSFVTVELTKIDNSEFIIYDMLGQVIKTVKVNTTKFNIDREEMKSGMYFYRLKNNGSVTGNGKLLIE